MLTAISKTWDLISAHEGNSEIIGPIGNTVWHPASRWLPPSHTYWLRLMENLCRRWQQPSVLSSNKYIYELSCMHPWIHPWKAIITALDCMFPEEGRCINPRNSGQLPLLASRCPLSCETQRASWWILMRENWKTQRKTCPTATWSTKNPTRTDTGVNLTLRNERLVRPESWYTPPSTQPNHDTD
jgi:hypothetical protein